MDPDRATLTSATTQRGRSCARSGVALGGVLLLLLVGCAGRQRLAAESTVGSDPRPSPPQGDAPVEEKRVEVTRLEPPGLPGQCQYQAPWPGRPAEELEPGVRVTHSSPQWPWPARYESSTPLFFLRLNRVIDPREVLAILYVMTDQDAGWRQPNWKIVRCLVEQAHDHGFTSVFFRLGEQLPHNSGVTWRIGGGGDWRLGISVAPAELNGSYLYNVFRTQAPQHPVGSHEANWTPAQLLSSHGQALMQAKLVEQEETLELLARLGDLSRSDRQQAPEPPPDPCQSLVHQRHQTRDDSGCPPCPCACNGRGELVCAPCARCEPEPQRSLEVPVPPRP